MVRFLILSVLSATLWLPLFNSVAMAQDEPANWQQEASERLLGIYDRGEFRFPAVTPQWSDDGLSYMLQEKDESGKPVTAMYNIESGERTVVENAKPDAMVSPDGKQKIKRKNRRIFIDDVAVTPKADGRDISFENIHWSPSGNYICFVEVDHSKVKQRSVLVPGDPTFPGVAKVRYARVGGKLPDRRVGIADAPGKNLIWLPIEIPDEGFYLGQVDWIDKSKWDGLLIETQSRFRDKREFLIASVDGGLDRMFTETNDAWAVGSHGINSGGKCINNDIDFIYVSEKDGWRRPWSYSPYTDKHIRLTTGEFDLIAKQQVDEENGWYYFIASPDNATQRYLYRVPLDGSGTLERITPKGFPGTHTYEMSPDSKWAVHTYSNINKAPVVDLVSLPDHKVVRVINDNSELQAKFDKTVSRPTEFVQIDIGGGVVMDASMTKPRDFDESKKYPVFVYVYGEPYLQTVLDNWGAAQIDFLRVVADAGYITLSIDNRGTAAPKGAAWRRSIFGSLGPLSTEEQAAALEKLGETYSYIDLDRVGIWGWSGGGSNTLNAMFRKPDVYDVGIAVVPKPQPWLYNAWFQEIYMRTREVNAEGYEKSAPINFAEGLKGKLLIVTGSGETNTHIQIIEGLIDKLIELGKPFDYMVYPNRDHGLRKGDGTVVHVRMLILRYLIENLPRGGR